MDTANPAPPWAAVDGLEVEPTPGFGDDERLRRRESAGVVGTSSEAAPPTATELSGRAMVGVSVAIERLQLGMAMAVALWLLLMAACGPARHDLEVVNAWDRGVTVSAVSERAGLPDQAVPLGPVRVGATERFSAALADGQERFHFRYGYHSGIYEEQTDVCVTREALQQAAWRLVIPTAGHSCR